MLSLEAQAKVQAWRRRAIEGTITLDEMREAVKVMREGRVSASHASAKSRAKKAPIDGDSLLGELDGL